MINVRRVFARACQRASAFAHHQFAETHKISSTHTLSLSLLFCHTCKHACMCVSVYAHSHTHTHTHTHAHAHTHTHRRSGETGRRRGRDGDAAAGALSRAARSGTGAQTVLQHQPAPPRQAAGGHKSAHRPLACQGVRRTPAVHVGHVGHVGPDVLFKWRCGRTDALSSARRGCEGGRV